MEAVDDALAVAWGEVAAFEVGGDDGHQVAVVAVGDDVDHGCVGHAVGEDFFGFDAEVVDHEEVGVGDAVEGGAVADEELGEVFGVVVADEEFVVAEFLIGVGADGIGQGSGECAFAVSVEAHEEQPWFFARIGEPLGDAEDDGVDLFGHLVGGTAAA